MECGDGAVVELGDHEVVVVGDEADEGIDRNEVTKDNGVVVKGFDEVANVVFVVDKLLAQLLPGASHGLLQPRAALFEGNVAGCGNFGNLRMNADECVFGVGKWLGRLLATQEWA